MQVKIQINKTRAVKKVTPQVKIDKKLKNRETGAKITKVSLRLLCKKNIRQLTAKSKNKIKNWVTILSVIVLY